MATGSSHTRPSRSASPPGVMVAPPFPARNRSSGSGSSVASGPDAVPFHGTNSPSGTASHTPLGAPSRAAPMIRPGSLPVSAANTAAVNPASTATSSTAVSADAAGRTTRCTGCQPAGSGVRREASSAISSTASTHNRPPSSVRWVSTWNFTEELVLTMSCSPSARPPLMPPIPGRPLSRSSVAPVDGPTDPASIATVSCPAQASPPSSAVNSTAVVTTRAASSPGSTVVPARRSDRRNTQASRTAPTRLTPSGVMPIAAWVSDPVRPNTPTSPVGWTFPPTAIATTAADIGPSAAVAAIAANAQLTEASAPASTLTHGVLRAAIPPPEAEIPPCPKPQPNCRGSIPATSTARYRTRTGGGVLLRDRGPEQYLPMIGIPRLPLHADNTGDNTWGMGCLNSYSNGTGGP